MMQDDIHSDGRDGIRPVWREQIIDVAEEEDGVDKICDV